MKKLNLAILIIIAMASCQKTTNIETKNSNIDNSKLSMQPIQVVYGPVNCINLAGGNGTQCGITTCEEGCTEETECVDQIVTTHYNHVLHELYSEEEIAALEPGTCISNPRLIEALKQDGLPIK